MPRKIKKYSEPEPINDGGLDVYTEVWAFAKTGDYEIYRVYPKKEDAEKACEIKNKELYDYSRNANKDMSDKQFDTYYNNPRSFQRKYSVMSLENAIDIIRDEVRDNAEDKGEDY